jgi:uncharacterized lipoprotein YmbA
MKRVLPGRPGMFILGLIAVVLCGCASSPPSRFYILSSLKNPEPAKPANSAAPAIVVAVGPIVIPDYLDKPGIVTRSGKNELNVNDFHRWAGDLESILSRTVIENLSALLPIDRFSVVRWSPGMQAPVPITYRLTMDVMRFDVTPSDAAFFETGWTLSGKEKEPMLMRRSVISAPVKGTDYDEMVAAMSKTIEDFSREIADVIKSRNNGT